MLSPASEREGGQQPGSIGCCTFFLFFFIVFFFDDGVLALAPRQILATTTELSK
jgi:hypothetical protein